MTNVSNLIQTASSYSFSGFLSFYPPEKWIFQPHHLPVLVQIEVGTKSDECIIFSSLARDSSGPLMTSFMTTLLIEGAHGISVDGLSVASGDLSISYFLKRKIANLDAGHFLQLLFNFAEVVYWSSPDLLPNTAAHISSRDDVSLPPQIL